MRLATCALSAILLSGCSWLGTGGGHSDVYGYSNYGYSNAGYGAYGQNAYGGGCGPAQGGHYYTQQYMTMPPGCGDYGKSYPFGQGQMGQGAPGNAGGYGQAGAYGMRGMAGSGYAGGAGGGATVLSSQAPYGSAVGGGAAGIAGAASVTSVQGSPIYVPQPYPAYYNAGAPALRGSMQGGSMGGGYYAGGGYYGGGYGAMCCGGGAMPLGVEASVGTEFAIGGNLFPGVESKPFLGGPGHVSDLDPISYKDAFKNGAHYGLAATYDLDPSTTLIGQIGISKAKGQKLKMGTVDDGGGVSEDLSAEFSDLEQIRIEGGLRRYMGHNAYGLRPYVGASAGFVNTQDVTLTQSSATLVDPALFKQTYIQGGWTPTASGIIGAEWQVGRRSALGVETGIRWSDDLQTNFVSDDQWSVPLKIRGRVSF